MSSVKFPSLERRGSHSARAHHSHSSMAPHPPGLSNPVAAVAASPHSSRSVSPASRPDSPAAMRDHYADSFSSRRRHDGTDGDGSNGGGSGAPPSLSHLVAASLSAAASHERAIHKWARDIQREVDEYKASIIAAKAGGTKGAGTTAAGENGGGGRSKKRAPTALQAQLGRLTAIDPAFSHTPHAPASSSLSPRRGALRDPFGSTSNSFMRDDIQSVHPRSAARFYPANLVKVHGNGSLSARDHSTAAARSQRQSQANAALYHHRATVMARKQAAAKEAEAHAAAQSSAVGAGDRGQLIAALYGAVSSPSGNTLPPPSAHAALHSLPPSLSPADRHAIGLGAANAGAIDVLESAAFKSPALYIDLRMRQLFHQTSSSSGGAPQSSSQKAHVVVHLVDVLGELVEPESQQAFQALSDTLKELILAAEYKNLIPVEHATAAAGHGARGTAHARGNGSSSSRNPSAVLAAQHKEMLRHEKLKWDAEGNLRPEAGGVGGAAGGGLWGAKSLAQSLADGSLDKATAAAGLGTGATAVGKPDRSRADRAREKEERAKTESLATATAASPAEDDPSAAGGAAADARRKHPSIVFDGDYADSAGNVNVSGRSKLLQTSVAPGAVVPFHSAPVLARTSPASLPSLRHVPAAYLEVGWTLKAEVERLCTRLEQLASASVALRAEEERLSTEQSYLHSWQAKKTLQLQLHSRGEANLANEVLLLKHLLVDLKEEAEQVNQENILLEEDYLANGLVFGGSFALEEFRYEEEVRNYPAELRVARHQMDGVLAQIERSKRSLHDIHAERDLLLTRIEVLTQAVSMMHNDEQEEEDESEDEEEENDEQTGEGPVDERARAASKSAKRLASASTAPVAPSLDPCGYPFVQQRPDDLRGRGSTNQRAPPCLRFDGWYPDLRLSQQDVEVRVKEVWSLKTIADEKAKQVGGRQTTLRGYFEEYLRKRFLGKDAVKAAQQQAEQPSDGAAATAVAAQDSASSCYALQEFVVNFFTTLERHFTDQDNILFLKVIGGELHEDHYRDQMQMLAHFKEAVFRWDLGEHVAAAAAASAPGGRAGSVVAIAGVGAGVAASGRVDGLIGRDTFLRGLRSFFPHKSDAHMAELAAILERDCMAAPSAATAAAAPAANLAQQDGAAPQPLVDVRKILSAGSEGDMDESGAGFEDGSGSSVDAGAMGGSYTSNFLECIRSQYLSEIDAFVSRIHADLLALCELRWMERARALAVRSGVPFRPSAPPADPHSASLSAYDIRCVLRAADLHRSTEELTELLRRGCNEPYLSRDTEVNIDAFMHNLVQSGLVHTTDHWRRVPPMNSSLDLDQTASERAAALAAEERKAAAADAEQDEASIAGSPYVPVHRLAPAFQRRASMEDEAVYLAARSAGGLPLEYDAR